MPSILMSRLPLPGAETEEIPEEEYPGLQETEFLVTSRNAADENAERMEEQMRSLIEQNEQLEEEQGDLKKRLHVLEEEKEKRLEVIEF